MAKKALCIGINYVGTEFELRGCINDADDWAKLLGTNGFDPAVLPEKQATKQQILTSMKLLIKQLVNPKASDREIDAIKARILETNRKSNKRWLSALNEAQDTLGRRDAIDAHYYRAILAEPLPRTKDSAMIEQP